MAGDVGTTAVKLQPDAMIFLPGIAAGWGEGSLEEMGRRIASELGRNAAAAQTTFVVERDVRNEAYGQGLKARVCTISRAEGASGTSLPVIDLYEMDYRKTLTGQFEGRNVLGRLLLALWAIFRNTRRLVAGITMPAKSRIDKLQLFYATFILVLLVAYLLLLVPTIASLGIEALEKLAKIFGRATSAPLADRLVGTVCPGGLWPELSRYCKTSLGFLRSLIIALAAVGAFVPEAKQYISRAAVDYLCAINYVSLKWRRNVLLGQFTDLVDHLAAKRGRGEYRRVHVVAYSFGTIVALDAFFAPDDAPSFHLTAIHTLATIGCPFDLIRNFWPDYFMNRHGRPGTPQRWINVYSPVDVLSSNFRNDSSAGDPQETVRLRADTAAPRPNNLLYSGGAAPESLSLLDLLVLWGLRAHGQYWEPKFEAELSCFGPLLKEMYAGDPVLS